MTSDIIKLNRFTTFPFLIDFLKREKFTLLNPIFWEDFNDRETMRVYKSKVGAESIYAMCLTYRGETIHHWNAFANGTSGCCIEFSPRKLFEILNSHGNIKHGKVEYVSLKNLTEFETDKIPYLKRLPFKPEKEYRIIATSNDEQVDSFDIVVDLDIIRKITISNKIPSKVYESMKSLMLELTPTLKGKIFHSTLYNNQKWINHFKHI